jgi:hypothetical protein
MRTGTSSAWSSDFNSAGGFAPTRETASGAKSYNIIIRKRYFSRNIMEIPCPHCQQILNVPDNLLGKKIRCSACQAVIEAKPPTQEEPPVVPTAKKKTPPPSDNPFALGEESSPKSHFEFDAPTDKVNVGVKLKMQAAANMMMLGLGYAVFISLVLLAPPIGMTIVAFFRPDRAPPLMAVGYVLALVWSPYCCVYTPALACGVISYLGAKALRTGVCSRGKVITGAVFSIFLGFQGFVLLVPFRIVMGIVGVPDGYFLLLYVLGFLSFIQTILSIWGGIRALIVIHRADVQEAIRAEEERVRKAEITK